MTCVKTGCHIYIEPYGIWAYGDAHMDRYEEVYAFRLVQQGREPTRGVKHFTVQDFDNWFDQDLTSMQYNSTLIAANVHVINHGYDGVPIA